MARKPKRGRPVPPLDERHYQAIALLVAGRMGYAEIAKAIGVDRRTLHRWRKRKDFDRALRKAFDKHTNEWRRSARVRRWPHTADDIARVFKATGLL
ncbi:hypothetical protein D3C81_959330 [compost metagenome]